MKKIIIISVVIALALSVYTAVFASEPGVLSDATSTSSAEKLPGTITMRTKLAQLYDLGVMENVGSGPYQYITRCEMAKIVTELLAMPDIYDTCDFTDVSEHNPYSGNIKFVSEHNIMSGYGDGLFLPDKDITYYETVKTFITLLGYEPLAMQKGGYPHGYLRVANELGMILYPGASDYKINKKEIADIIYEAINVPLMIKTQYNDKVEYQISEETIKNGYLTSGVPRFNGPEYTGRILQIAELKAVNGGYTFKNSLDKEDEATYIVNSDTYIYLSENTLELSEIKNDMYAQCWHYTDDKDNIELLKIELMKEKPSGI